MAISQFIPTVWSARMQESLQKNLVLGKLCNRNYEGEIAHYGDTVQIGALADFTVKPYTPGMEIDDPEQLDGATDRSLKIDHGVYYNFTLNDVDAAQARADLMESAVRQAAQRLAEDTEQYILGVMKEGAGETLTKAMPEGGVYELLVEMKTVLDGKNVPRTGRKVVMSPAVEAQLLLDNRFVTAGSHLAEHALADGAIARAAGFDIYISNDLNNEMIALTEDGVTFAQQIAKTEAYRREKGFEDGVKGLSLCGAKVIVPECVLLVKLSA